MLHELEKLVHQRTIKPELLEELKRIDSTFELCEADEYEYTEGEDYRFDIINRDGIGSIWYAVTRAGDIYITEVSYCRE